MRTENDLDSTGCVAETAQKFLAIDLLKCGRLRFIRFNAVGKMPLWDLGLSALNLPFLIQGYMLL